MNVPPWSIPNGPRVAAGLVESIRVVRSTIGMTQIANG